VGGGSCSKAVTETASLIDFRAIPLSVTVDAQQLIQDTEGWFHYLRSAPSFRINWGNADKKHYALRGS